MELLLRAIVTDLVQTVAVLAVATMAYPGLNRVTASLPGYVRQIALGVLFGTAAVLCMTMTVATRQDAFISAAPAAAALAGPFGGALAAGVVPGVAAPPAPWRGGA